jgi:hypothetical protein
MYFWRIEALKADLRRGALDQRSAFAYLVATFLLYAVAAEVPGMLNAQIGPVRGLDWLAILSHLFFVGAGTYWAFRVNGGPLGTDFAVRYLAIGWVVGIRVMALLLLAVGILATFILIGTLTEFLGEPSERVWHLVGLLLGVGFDAILYWRLAHHIRNVATTSGAAGGPGNIAG